MASTFELEIVTPDKSFYDGEVDMVIVRSTEGDIGILKDHEPLVAPVAIGVFKVIIGEEKKIAACSGGFVNITEEKVTIITDSAEWASEIDADRARASMERASLRIQEAHSETDVDRAKISLVRATNRLRITDKNIDHSNL